MQALNPLSPRRGVGGDTSARTARVYAGAFTRSGATTAREDDTVVVPGGTGDPRPPQQTRRNTDHDGVMPSNACG